MLTEPDWWRARSAARTDRVLPEEAVSLSAAEGRTLSRDAVSLCDLPSFASSAMDGWAVSATGPWRVVGEVLAGSGLPTRLPAGTAVVIATGAVVPAGTTGIVRRENGIVVDGVLSSDQDRASDIRPAGEEAVDGQVLLPAGTTLTPAAVGLLAAAGYDDLWVRRRPRVALLLLGDELLAAGPPRDGLVRDSLGPQLPGWLARMGCTCSPPRPVPDNLPDLVATIGEACSDHDVVMTTGGTAAGPVDHLHGAIAEVGGRLLVNRVAVRPGHPMMLAEVLTPSPTRLVGLPGNPQSAIVALLTLGQPLVDSLLGKSAPELSEVVTATSVGAPTGETRLVAGTAVGGVFHPAAHLASHMLRGLAVADGFAVVPPAGVPAQARVPWLPLP